MSKKHSIQEGGRGGGTTPTALHHLALYHMAERGMAETDPQHEGPGADPAGKEIRMETLSPRGPSPTSIQNPFMDPGARTIKSESMQVDHPGGTDHPPRDEGPGTPLRGSVITSARELHTGQDEAGHSPDGYPGAAERHLASLYSGLAGGHEAGPGPVSVAVAPGLGMQMDPRAYGGLLHQGLLHRELLSRLGQFAAGMTREGPAQGQLCCGECGLQLHSRQALEQHR